MIIWIDLKAIQLLQGQVLFQSLHLNWSFISLLYSVFQFFSRSFFFSFSISFIFVDEGPIGLRFECELQLLLLTITSLQYELFFSLCLLSLWFLKSIEWSCVCVFCLVFIYLMILYVPLVLVVEQSEVGLKKEFREMLPIIVYNETFFVTDTLWVFSFLCICLLYFGKRMILFWICVLVIWLALFFC